MTRYARFIALTFVVAVFALGHAATGQSYTGDWPATVTQSQRSDGTYCISLTDDGSYGLKHSGPASLLPNNSPYPGYFTVVDGLITVTITYESGEGECCSYEVFTARASDGKIGNGAFNYLGITDIGLLTFGKKGGCS